MKTRFFLVFAFLLLPMSVQAQSAVDLASIERSLPLVTRAELEESLIWHQDIIASEDVDDDEREKAIEAAAYIETRLIDGDFRAGDQIIFYVEGEVDFPDTLVVEGGPSVLIPNVGNVSLDGILRSELQDHLARELSRFIRDPTVRALPTIRLTMGGRIGSPGFYTFQAGMPLGEAVMAAGGPTTDGRMDAIKVQREGLVLYGGDEVQDAIAQGLTFDQLGMRPGDEVFVPEEFLTLRRVVTWGLGAVSFLLLGYGIYGRGGGG